MIGFVVDLRLKPIVAVVGTMLLLTSGAATSAPTKESGFVYGSADDGGDDIDGQFGPYDYYKPIRIAIPLVERAHMGYEIAEQARKGDWCGYYLNLDYSLRALPNHPKALTLMAEYLETRPTCKPSRESGKTTSGAIWAIENNAWQERNMDYYFQTALNFMTEDTRVIPKHAETHVLYADWLRKKKRFDEAMKQYESAHVLKPGYANTYYGLGMLYLDQKNIAKATENARKAYSLGKPPADLQERLVAAGAWPASTATQKTAP